MMLEPKLTEANYTKLFNDVSILTKERIAQLFSGFSYYHVINVSFFILADTADYMRVSTDVIPSNATGVHCVLTPDQQEILYVDAVDNELTLEGNEWVVSIGNETQTNYGGSIRVEYTLPDSSISLYHTFTSMWRYYEICDKDEDVFYQIVYDTYFENYLYFRQMYDNYYKEYDYALGNRRTMKRHDASHSEGTFDGDVTDDTTKSDYDLPNKVVSSSTADGYMTGKSIDNVHQITDNENSKDSTYDSEITHVYDNEFLDLKKKYLEQIRNLFREFSAKFSDCFLHIYS